MSIQAFVNIKQNFIFSVPSQLLQLVVAIEVLRYMRPM